MTIDIAAIEAAIAELRSLLKEGLLVATVWDRTTGLPLVGYNSSPVAVALLTGMYDTTNRHLALAGLPPIHRHMFAELEGSRGGFIIRHQGELLLGMLVDLTKTNVGVLVSVALPRLLQRIGAAPA
jgi:hypothetical protein